MKFQFVLLCIFMTSSLCQAANPEQRLNQNGVALCEDRDSKLDSDCYDPVSYLKNNKAEKVGAENSKAFRFKFKVATYVFLSQEHLDLFKKNPEEYLPQFGGWCAYAVATKSKKVDIDPKSFHVQSGRLLLFYDGTFADTRKTWLNDKKKDSKSYLTDADTNWPSVKNKEL